MKMPGAMAPGITSSVPSGERGEVHLPVLGVFGENVPDIPGLASHRMVHVGLYGQAERLPLGLLALM